MFYVYICVLCFEANLEENVQLGQTQATFTFFRWLFSIYYKIISKNKFLNILKIHLGLYVSQIFQQPFPLEDIFILLDSPDVVPLLLPPPNSVNSPEYTWED